MAARKIGDVVVAQNGYSYTYIAGPDKKPMRVLTHWVIAREKYGRPKHPTERVVFVDGDRSNLDPDNIEYVPSGKDQRKSLERRKRTLQDRIREMQAELEDIESDLKELDRVRSNGRALTQS